MSAAIPPKPAHVHASAVARRERGVMLVGALSVFSFAFQQNVMNPMLPALEREFDASTTWATWLITSFLVVGATTAPLLGRLGDHSGRKGVLIGSLAVFTIASAVAGAAPNMWVLIACRGVCGVSGAFVPLCFALLTQHLRAQRVGTGVGGIASGIALGAVLGVTLGPFLADTLSWRYTFLVSAVLGAAALVAAARALPTAEATRRTTIDVAGTATLTVAIATLMLALTEADNWGSTSLPFLLLLATSAAAAASWLAVETRVAEPMVDIRMLRQPALLATVAATFLAGVCIFTWIMLVPRMVAVPRGQPVEVARLVDYGFGADSTAAGLFLLPAQVGAVITSAALSAVVARAGWRLPFMLCFGGLTVSCAGLAVWHAAPWQVYVLAAMGAGIGPLFAIGAKLVGDQAPLADHALISGLTTVSFYIGGALGAQAAAAVLAANSIAGTTVPTNGAFTASFVLCAVAAFVALPFAALSTGRRAGRPTAEGALG